MYNKYRHLSNLFGIIAAICSAICIVTFIGFGFYPDGAPQNIANLLAVSCFLFFSLFLLFGILFLIFFILKIVEGQKQKGEASEAGKRNVSVTDDIVCPNCKGICKEGDAFCSYCGKPLARTDDAVISFTSKDRLPFLAIVKGIYYSSPLTFYFCVIAEFLVIVCAVITSILTKDNPNYLMNIGLPVFLFLIILIMYLIVPLYMSRKNSTQTISLYPDRIEIQTKIDKNLDYAMSSVNKVFYFKDCYKVRKEKGTYYFFMKSSKRFVLMMNYDNFPLEAVRFLDQKVEEIKSSTSD